MTEPSPLVSIALCTCNGEAHLRHQIESLLGQDYGHLEIVVVDDASTDSTPDIIEGYAGEHPHIRFHRNSQRLGLVDNFQKCLRLCRGEFIALCDQDDVWYPHKISTLLGAIGDCALAYAKVRVVDESGQALNRVHPRRRMLDGNCALSLVLTNFVTGHASLLRADLLDHALPVAQGLIHDQWLAFCAASSEGGIVHVDQVLSDYRLHGSNQILGASRGRKKRVGPADLHAFAARCEEGQEEAKRIRELAALMKRPFLLYNFALHRFLKAHPQFLAAHYRPGQVRRKLCMRRAH